jgi:hypothetical protein
MPGQLIDTPAWEAASPVQLIDMVAGMQPTGQLAAAIGYTGEDLVAAAPLPAEELAQEYSPPCEQFRAGLGFQNIVAWGELVGRNTETWQWVQNGYSELVKEYNTMPRIEQSNNKNTALHEAFVTESVASLLEVQAVKDVTAVVDDLTVVRAVCPLTVAEQAGGKLRLCWNGTPVNKYLPSRHFKMEHAEKAAAMMRPGDWMFTLDMKSGYHQVPCKESFKRLLCFIWQSRVYQWQVMPFGLSTAPRAYSKLTRQLLECWRAQGMRCSNYIDDFIFFAPSREEALRIRAMVLRDLARLGWFISANKSMLQPGTMVKYLGLVFCSLPQPHVRVPPEKVQRVREAFAGVVRRAATGAAVCMQGRSLASVLGFLQSLQLAVSLVPVFTRELYACMAQLPRSPEGWYVFGHKAVLSEAAVAECRLWAACIQRWNGFLVAPVHVSRVVYTDGCSGGFGGLVHRVLGRRVEPAVQSMSGTWEATMSVDSVMTELVGLWRVLAAAGQELAGQTVLHRTDSISTYSVLAKGGSQRSERLTAVVRRVMVYCLLFNINLASQYVGAGVIIKSGADMLSRERDVSDCKLASEVFAELWSRLGPFTVDMFASGASVQLVPGTRQPLPYWSLWADGVAKGVDALTADWQAEAAGGVVYAFPPVPLVGDVIQLVVSAGVRAVVILPQWRSQWWWPWVLQHAKMAPVSLRQLRSEVMVASRPGGPSHPFGPGWQDPQSVEWLAVLF